MPGPGPVLGAAHTAMNTIEKHCVLRKIKVEERERKGEREEGRERGRMNIQTRNLPYNEKYSKKLRMQRFTRELLGVKEMFSIFIVMVIIKVTHFSTFNG